MDMDFKIMLLAAITVLIAVACGFVLQAGCHTLSYVNKDGKADPIWCLKR